jgi:mannose-6-phosphate isomerase-like protein (cupin superfamily)
MFSASYRNLVRFDPSGMVKVNLFESHRMFADLYCLMPGQEQRVHSHHDNDKLYFVLEGSGTIVVGSQSQRLSAGASAVARAGEPHGVRNESAENLVVLVAMAPHPTLKQS